MSWIVQFLRSSIGQKLIMSLTGLFLVIFLLVHLIGNLQLFNNDGGEAFNVYTEFMGHNPFIQFTAKGLYFFIILHAVQGILMALKNKKAKGSKYAVKAKSASWSSKNMMLLGSLVLAFLFIHMGDFWWSLKFDGNLPTTKIDGVEMKDAFAKVTETFTNPLLVVAYLIGLLALAFHLNHGFQSAFQTLGLNHSKYTPIIKSVGTIYSILIPLGFAIMPLYIFFTNQ